MSGWSWKRWGLLLTAVVLVALLSVGAAAYWLLRSGITQPIDNQFGDQHLKTVVALVELHKTRYGRYPAALAELKFTGSWDAIALNAVSYCASKDRNTVLRRT